MFRVHFYGQKKKIKYNKSPGPTLPYCSHVAVHLSSKFMGLVRLIEGMRTNYLIEVI